MLVQARSQIHFDKTPNFITKYPRSQMPQMPLFLSILILLKISLAFAIDEGLKCPSEWRKFNGSCFKYIAINAHFLSARQYCWESGGGADLASIHSAEENAFVQNLLNGANSTGGNGFLIGLLFEHNRNVFWSDDSPVDFGSPVGMPLGTFPWHSNINGNTFPSEPDYFETYEYCTILMAGDYTWADRKCLDKQPGFICKKDATNDADNSVVVPRLYELKTDAALWPHPVFSFFSILLQFYVIWLIIWKSPKGMRNYRHFLCASTASDIAVTFIIGFLMVPENWMPNEIGATIHGLAKYFSQRGGQITFCMAVFAIVCQIGFQLISLFYRFACIMDREWPKFSLKISQTCSRITMFMLVLILALTISILSQNVTLIPEDPQFESELTIDYGSAMKLFSDTNLAKVPIILLEHIIILNVFGGFIVGVLISQAICIFITVAIIRYLRANSQHFTSHTYKLQLQLMVSLLVQLLLPCIFVGVPVIYVFFLCVKTILFRNQNTDMFPGKSATDLGIFFFEIYALLNPLTLICFVTHYRRHFAKITAFNWFRQKFNALFGQQNQISPAAGGQIVPIPLIPLQTTRLSMNVQTPKRETSGVN